MPAQTALALRELLGYEEDEAGGIMTTALVTAKSGEKIKKVVDRLSEAREHGADLDAVAVVDSDGRLLGDVSVLDILLALRTASDTRMSALLGDEDVVTVSPHASASEVAGQLVEARRHSLVVVDDDGAPIGRILADDVLDALVPTKGRFHFPRLSVVNVRVPRRWLIYLAAAGPGLIAAAAGNDAGGIVTYSSAGAQFVYRTLFLMVLITVAYVVVQEMVARLAVYTGKGLAALIREEFDLRLTAFAIMAFAIANIGLMVTEFGGIATAFELFGVSRYISVPIAAVAIWSLVLFGSYRYAERVFLLLTLVFIAYPIAAVLGPPRLAPGGGQHGVAPLRRLEVVPPALGRPHRHHHHAVHPALRGGCGGRQGGQARAVPLPARRRHHRRHARRAGGHVDHRGHRGHHRRNGAAHVGRHRRQGARARRRRRRRRPLRARAARRLRPGRRGRAAVDLLRGRRGDRGRALGLVELPPGPRLPGDLHLPDPRSGQPWCSSPATSSPSSSTPRYSKGSSRR